MERMELTAILAPRGCLRWSRPRLHLGISCLFLPSPREVPDGEATVPRGWTSHPPFTPRECPKQTKP